MQQLFDQLQLLLQNSLHVSRLHSLADCCNYPSSLNQTYLTPSGNYNNAANRVPWFHSSLFSLSLFSSCNMDKQHLHTKPMPWLPYLPFYIPLDGSAWCCTPHQGLPNSHSFPYTKEPLNSLHTGPCSQWYPDTHMHTSKVASRPSVISHNHLDTLTAELF